MRFTTLATALTVLVAATAIVSAVPIKREEEGDIQTISKGVCFIEAGLGVTTLLDTLDTSLGGLVSYIEKVVGVTALEEALGLLSCEDETSGKSSVELIGAGLCEIQKGLGVTAILDLVDELVGGAVSALEDQLGITSLEENLYLSGC